MALIRCLACGKDISDQASFCPNCGNPVSTKSSSTPSQDKDSSKPESKLFLYGYPGFWALETKIKVYIDDDLVGEIGSIRKSSPTPFVYEITKDCELNLVRPLAFLHKKIKVDIKAGEVTRIQPEWNRVTGGLDLIAVTPETVKK